MIIIIMIIIILLASVSYFVSSQDTKSLMSARLFI